MILLWASRARDGLVRVIDWRAVLTRWVGSLMKCLVDAMVMCVVWCFTAEGKSVLLRRRTGTRGMEGRINE